MVIAAVVMSIVALCLALANMLIGGDHVDRLQGQFKKAHQCAEAAHARLTTARREFDAHVENVIARIGESENVIKAVDEAARIRYQALEQRLHKRIGSVEDITTDCEVLRQRLHLIEAGVIAILESPTKASRDFLKESKAFTKQHKAAQRDAARN